MALLTIAKKALRRWLRQGSAALILIFIIVVIGFTPITALAVESAAKTCAAENAVIVLVKNVALEKETIAGRICQKMIAVVKRLWISEPLGKICPDFHSKIDQSGHRRVALSCRADIDQQTSIVKQLNFHDRAYNGGRGIPDIDQIIGDADAAANWPSLLVFARDVDVADDDFGSVSGDKFGASEPKLVEIHNPQSSSRNEQKAGKNHEPQIVVGYSLFDYLLAFLAGCVIGLVIIFGGGALAWRLWGV